MDIVWLSNCHGIILSRETGYQLYCLADYTNSSLSKRGDKRDCGAPCHAMFFPEKERTVLRYWVGSWAAVCVASCLFTKLQFSVKLICNLVQTTLKLNVDVAILSPHSISNVVENRHALPKGERFPKPVILLLGQNQKKVNDEDIFMPKN
uniref:Uncharacterized protein n=1 Tax=Glossina pallidipes TaxID=7398 RepID=A0A1B0A6N4_GLOPL